MQSKVILEPMNLICFEKGNFWSYASMPSNFVWDNSYVYVIHSYISFVRLLLHWLFWQLNFPQNWRKRDRAYHRNDLFSEGKHVTNNYFFCTKLSTANLEEKTYKVTPVKNLEYQCNNWNSQNLNVCLLSLHGYWKLIWYPSGYWHSWRKTSQIRNETLSYKIKTCYSFSTKWDKSVLVKLAAIFPAVVRPLICFFQISWHKSE